MSPFLVIYFLVVMVTGAMLLAFVTLTGLCWLARRSNPWAPVLSGYFALHVLAAGWIVATEFVPALEVREIRAAVYRTVVSLASLGLGAWLLAWLLARRRNGDGPAR